MDKNQLYLAAKTLMESSSSSSSSDDEEIATIVLASLPEHDRENIKSMLNFETEFVAEFQGEQFRRTFRMTRESMEFIAFEFRNSSSFPYKLEHYQTQKRAEQLLLAFLWYAGSNLPFTKTSPIFNMNDFKLSKAIDCILEFFDENCARFIKFPRTAEELHSAAEDFKKISQFPNVIGCIDGTYIPIRTPNNKIRSTYADRHDGTSITLQGICDANRRFIDIFVGSPAKIHDSRIFKLSFIYDEVPIICGTKYHLLGDGAYPISPYMMTPFRFTRENPVKDNYNKKLSATRVRIENAFGQLKGRFNQLRYVKFFDVKKISLFVKACCVMHNICIDRADEWINDIDMTVPSNNNNDRGAGSSNALLKRQGEEKRMNIALALR